MMQNFAQIGLQQAQFEPANSATVPKLLCVLELAPLLVEVPPTGYSHRSLFLSMSVNRRSLMPAANWLSAISTICI
eukprot:5292-Heterococcus_DN1.PRE.4